MKKMRVLHTPMNSGGHPVGLSSAEKKADIDSSIIILSENRFGYHSDLVLWENTRSRLAMEFKRISLIRRAIKEFDIIHYNAGTTIAAPILPPSKSVESKHNFVLQLLYHKYLTILQKFELAMVKKANKGIFVTFQGSDSRQGQYCSEHYEIHTNIPGNGYYSPASDKAKRERIKLLDRYADHLYALNPDLLNVLPERTKFIPYASVDLEKWQAIARPPNKRVKVVHAPTNRKMKGTDHILQAVERLHSEGFDFDFELVENMSREQARLTYEKADVLVDQLLIGWYGGLAVELMALGKPVICYIRKDDLKHIPEKMRNNTAIINASPDTIYDVLKDFILNFQDGYEERSHSARGYVETWHNPEKIADAICKDYEDVMVEKGISGSSDWQQR